MNWANPGRRRCAPSPGLSRLVPSGRVSQELDSLVNHIFMFGSLRRRSARRTPDADRAVEAGGGDALAVGEVGHAGHGAGVPFVIAQLLAGRHVPDAHRVIVETAGDDAFAAGRE